MSSTPTLDRIEQVGTRRVKPGGFGVTKDGLPSNHIVCADGFALSVVAGYGAYCSPRPSAFSNLADVPPTYGGPYHEVEVGFPSQRPEPWRGVWETFAETPEHPTGTVYGYVPVGLVRSLIESHGGEA